MMSETVSAFSMTSCLDQQVQLGSSEASEGALTGIYADIGRPDIADPGPGLRGRGGECGALAARWGWRRRGGQLVTWFELQALLRQMQHSAVSGKGLDFA
jgi:hypothetical protein